MTHGLGRRLAPDERDERYPAQVRLSGAPDRTYRYWWDLGARLDQGQTGTCVGHAWEHLIQNSPVTDPGDEPDPFGIYREAVADDEWGANDHEATAPDDQLQFGTSVRAGARVLQRRGLIETYRWAWDVETAVDWVLEKGPVVLGTVWLDGMFVPDRSGYLSVSGEPVGGHAYLMTGANVRAGKVRCLNSWGESWGQGGSFWLRMEDLARLLADQGEACMTVELAD